jgi:hypothetical protein
VSVLVTKFSNPQYVEELYFPTKNLAAKKQRLEQQVESSKPAARQTANPSLADIELMKYKEIASKLRNLFKCTDMQIVAEVEVLVKKIRNPMDEEAWVALNFQLAQVEKAKGTFKLEGVLFPIEVLNEPPEPKGSEAEPMERRSKGTQVFSKPVFNLIKRNPLIFLC